MYLHFPTTPGPILIRRCSNRLTGKQFCAQDDPFAQAVCAPSKLHPTLIFCNLVAMLLL